MNYTYTPTFFNILQFDSNLPTFLEPYKYDVACYFSSNHFIDKQPSELIEFDIAKHIIDNYVINTSNELIKDEIFDILLEKIDVASIHGFIKTPIKKSKAKPKKDLNINGDIILNDE